MYYCSGCDKCKHQDCFELCDSCEEMCTDHTLKHGYLCDQCNYYWYRDLNTDKIYTLCHKCNPKFAESDEDKQRLINNLK